MFNAASCESFLSASLFCFQHLFCCIFDTAICMKLYENEHLHCNFNFVCNEIDLDHSTMEIRTCQFVSSEAHAHDVVFLAAPAAALAGQQVADYAMKLCDMIKTSRTCSLINNPTLRSRNNAAINQSQPSEIISVLLLCYS